VGGGCLEWLPTEMVMHNFCIIYLKSRANVFNKIKMASSPHIEL